LTATAEAVVPIGVEVVTLSFGRAPPDFLKFSVTSGSDSSFTITLDQKFMRKTFMDAVVVPFVTMHNRRHPGGQLEAQQLVEVHLDGQKVGGHLPTQVKKTAFAFLGHHPAVCELFFSWAAVKAKEKLPHQGLRFKIWVGSAGEWQKEKDFEWDHKELNSADGVELGRQLQSLGPFKDLKRLYLGHNTLGDVGVAAIMPHLNRKHTPSLIRLQLSKNRIGNAGVKAICDAWDPSPNLHLLTLDENWIGDEGARLLLEAAKSDMLLAQECHLFLNPGISNELKALLKEVNKAGDRKCLFNFNEPDTGHVWDDRGAWTETPAGERIQLSGQQFKM